MKFFATVAMATILFTTSATAQHVNIGIKGGLNVYNISNNNGPKYDSKVGFNAGLLGHIHLAKQLAFQPELVYSAQGAKFTTSSIETKLNLGYINIPLLIQYMFDNGFRLQAGPQIGFLVSAKAKTGSTEIDLKNNLKKVDFALGAGIGYVHPASGFGVDARYNIGLSNINENGSVKSYNRGLQVGIFYLFKHK
jgi:Outer membrane protein beta-barrel domain